MMVSARPGWFSAIPILAVLVTGCRIGPRVVAVSMRPPNDEVRFYHARVELTASQKPYRITHAAVDGSDAFLVPYVRGRAWQDELTPGTATVKTQMPAGEPVVVHLRHPWESGGAYRVALGYALAGPGAKQREVRAGTQAPAAGGHVFPEWKENRLVVLVEQHGIPRRREPVTVFLSAHADEVGSFDQEVRVARLDAETGRATEVPSQVLMEKVLMAKVLPDGEEGAPSTRMCQALFPADVPAHGRSLYVIAYGNPAAEKPTYATEMRMRKDEDGTVIMENSCCLVELHPRSGQINGIQSKKFGYGHARSFGFSDYQLHYNPDVWVKDGQWTHTSDWDPPPNVSVTHGPLAIVTRRWGALPNAPEVEVCVTYIFLAGAPCVLVESVINVKKDIRANALRSDEFVFRPAASIDHVGWKEPGGSVHYKGTGFQRGRRRGMMAVTASDAPYVCVVREESKLGLASVHLKRFVGSYAGGPPTVSGDLTALADYGWGFRYWSRVLVYPWGDNQPDRALVLSAGTFYATRTAYCVFPLQEGESAVERLAYLEKLDRRLRSPLVIDHQGAGPW